jgi:imidazole glycerol-phosphate synthase subunit HisH
MKNNSPMVVVDSGMGNLASVANMIRKIGGEAKISSSPDEIRRAQKLILPGVGSFDAGIKALKERSLDIAVKAAVKENGSMLLGICLGMQLLFESSEEGNQSGLGLVSGHVHYFQLNDKKLRVPHMGWNIVKPKRSSALFSFEDEQRFYFVHSYHARCSYAEDVSATTHHGYDFVSATESGNVMGVQFHPEKSHRFGMALFKRFLDLQSC